MTRCCGAVTLPKGKALFAAIDRPRGPGYDKAPAQEHPHSMTEFDDRERAEEKRFQLDQEQEFKAHARRARLTGEWAANLLGLSGEAAADYAKNLIIADLEEAGEEDIFRKVRADFDAGKLTLSDHQIRVKMAELLQTARAQVKAAS